MIKLAVEEIVVATEGRAYGPTESVGYPQRAVIDSRSACSGDLFFGLLGSRANGGDFAAEALAAGAWGAVVTQEYVADLTRSFPDRLILAVKDPLLALQRLATAWRKALGCKVIGIYGTVGKTSTKDILAALLARDLKVHKTPGNYNTEIGVPLTILGADVGTEVLVLELAMRGSGQIAELTRVAQPDVGVLLNIGPEHLELLGSLEQVAAAEAELMQELPAAAAVVLPLDEPLLRPYIGARDDLRYLTFTASKGNVAKADANLEQLTAWNGEVTGVTVNYCGRLIKLELPLPQSYLAANTVAAVAAAELIGLKIKDGRIDVQLSALRGENIKLADGTLLINDCHNANPVSMAAAVGDLIDRAADGRAVAVLGDMLELGEQTQFYHRQLGSELEAAGVELVVAVGALAADIKGTYSGNFQHVDTAQLAAALALELIQPLDTVLIKGSRGVGLELIAEQLRQQRGEHSG